MAKYTDEQIKKAVKHCLESKFEDFCEECPFYDDADACENQLPLLLDLINRQEAEKAELQREIASYKSKIERLRKENKLLSEDADTAFQDGLNEAQDLYAEQIKSEIKSEAIKEFAERLKEEVTYYEDECGEFIPYVDCRDIDNLVKEMDGEASEGVAC